MYPVTFAADIPLEGRERLSVALRYLFGIPVLIVGAVYGIGAFFQTIYAWFSIIFTGRYPDGAYEFNTKYLRLLGRANGYLYLATDESPPLNGDPDDSYPVRIGIPPPLGMYDRLKTGLRMLFGIPVQILNFVQGVIGGVVAAIAWFAIVFTGKMPEGLVEPLRGALAYSTKASAYFLLMTEDWPPFSEEGGAAPAGEIRERTGEPREPR